MSRRSRRTFKRRAVAAGIAAGVFAWAWQTHPVALALTLTAAIATVALTLYGRRARHEQKLNADGQPTVVYQHWFRKDLIQPFLDAGYPPAWFGYTGISNSYTDRCEQHSADSWWWILIDPTRSAVTAYPNRYAALAAETALIAERCGVGNTQGNPAYRRQTGVRESLQVYAHQLHQQVLTYGRTG